MPRAEQRSDLISIAEQQRLRRAGFKISDIAKKAGRSETTMVRRFRRWGVVPDEKPVFSRRSRPRLLDGREDEIKRLHWEENLSTRQMAERLSVGHMTVLKFMHARGIEVRSREDAARLRLETAPPVRFVNSGAFTSESAKEARKLKLAKEKRRARINARRRELHREKREAQHV